MKYLNIGWRWVVHARAAHCIDFPSDVPFLTRCNPRRSGCQKSLFVFALVWYLFSPPWGSSHTQIETCWNLSRTHFPHEVLQKSFFVSVWTCYVPSAMTPECQNLPREIYIFLTLVQWIFAAFSLIRKQRIWATTGDAPASKSSEREAQLRHDDLL